MGRYIKTRIVTDGLIYLNDAGNSKSYSGVGTAVKNLVGYGATNTTFNQTFVSSGTTSYFVSTGSTSYISNTNVSVSASTGSGFTICMMIKPQTLTSSTWNYFFQQYQSSSNSLIEIGRYGTTQGFSLKDTTKNENSILFETSSVNSDYFEWYSKVPGYNGSITNQKIQYCVDNSLSSAACETHLQNSSNYLYSSGFGTYTTPSSSGIITANYQTTWVVPVGVTSITAVCVGGGGGSGGNDSGNGQGAGGGGGGLSYGTFAVTPGETLYIQSGAGGKGGNVEILNYYQDNNTTNRPKTDGTNGGDSYIKRVGYDATGTDILILSGGGSGGSAGSSSSSDSTGGTGGIGGQGSASSGGGNGGNGGNGYTTFGGGGGGGAGGYTGAGGTGGYGYVSQTAAQRAGGTGQGGGGGGGGSLNVDSGSSGNFNSGGGVGIYNATRTTGAGGTSTTASGSDTSSKSGLSGSSGTAPTGSSGRYGIPNTFTNYSTRAVGGIYGGGGGASYQADSSNSWREPANGGRGCVRIVWGTGRTFSTSSTVAQDVLSQRSASFSDWTFVVCGVTTDYKSFLSTNGSSKSVGVSTDWMTTGEINLDKIFGTGSDSAAGITTGTNSNYKCHWNNCMIYNRELTNEEIQINFEAFRRKFNL
jgi:hypothetical protein